MNQIQKHLTHMLAGEHTTLAHLTDELMADLRTVNHDRKTLELLGRHVLTLVSADLKSGVHAQKAMHTAMNGYQ